MDKFNLINKNTKEETICEKRSIGGVDYYVCDTYKVGELVLGKRRSSGQYECGLLSNREEKYVVPSSGDGFYTNHVKGIIATNDIGCFCNNINDGLRIGFTIDKNHQEFNSYSEDNMFEFVKWVGDNNYYLKHQVNDMWYDDEYYIGSTKDILEMWKRQQVKIIYYI